MFTGLVEEIGTVAELNPHDETGGTSLTITLPATSKLLEDAGLGDSIAVNGVCLTATALTGAGENAGAAQQPSFKVGIAPETLRLTNLGALKAGSDVNLERAVRADTRMGGHFVQGHVDATAEIVKIAQDGNALTFRFRPLPQAHGLGAEDKDKGSQKQEQEQGQRAAVLRYIVHKGFVALDGTSLTITRVDDVEGWFEVMLIAYTQEKVVLARKKVGETVNVEVDVLAKYAEKSMAGYLGGVNGGDQMSLVKPVIEAMVRDMVAQAMGGHAAS